GLLRAGPPEGWAIPAVSIRDEPRFSWRGLHLDVGRHFFGVEFVKRYLDQMASFKFNRFHWHLTEDQGWRIEIEAYPKLTEVGAWRDGTLVGHYGNRPHTFDGERYGGFYTQDEIREIVAYAAARHITVVPEIELPGHSSAALAAYPEFGCGEGPVEVAQLWGVFEDIYCPHEQTFGFLETVFDEVLDLFPSPWIHIGGDEAPKAQWERSAAAQEVIRREGLADERELQSWFIRRIERHLNAAGRRLIGWDEIVEGGLSPTATLMFWRDWNAEALELAASQGNDVVMTPNSVMYFDHYQADPEGEPVAIGGLTTLEDVYAFDPVPEPFRGGGEDRILGAQANLWTEYIPTPQKAEYMAYPRAVALAEVVWSAEDQRDWTSFQARLSPILERLDLRSVNYRRPDR
ncbi:MAG: family 20 glycosylhydrolase, partial [Gemmatimonadetes bacterium]|nr:family 20 glycosylhydrolase [Gemmatimonadota bacterium]